MAAALIAGAAVSVGWTDAHADRARATAPASLRINEIQVLGSHNSYHVEPRPDILSAYLEVDPDAIVLAYTHAPLTTQLEQQGIRQFELDLVGDPSGNLFRPLGTPGWKVLHIEQIDEGSTCPTLVDCLTEIEAWSADHPDHVVVTVLVEFKTPGEVEGGVDAPEVTPDAMQAFEEEVRSVFTAEQLVTPDAEEIGDAVQAGYIVRTRADVPVETVRSGDTTRREAAFASGAQFVSTDFPVPGLSLRWGTDYVAQLPGGGPARCNPVTAPPDCDPATIERAERSGANE